MYLRRSSLNIINDPLFIWSFLTKNIDDLKVGSVYKVNYFLATNALIKHCSFTGICLSLKRTSNSFILHNFFKGESFEFSFFSKSPIILEIKSIAKYRRKVHFSKLYYLRTSFRRSL